MADPHCVVEEPAAGEHGNCPLVVRTGIVRIFCLDEQERDLSEQVGIIRLGLEDLTVERKRFASVSLASPTGGTCCSPKNLISI
jgi:hypothetical protein